jgi:type II secretory ATPase GspE/PulE/Tfp pilus assembly ATPase PilB-like protein
MKPHALSNGPKGTPGSAGSAAFAKTIVPLGGTLPAARAASAGASPDPAAPGVAPSAELRGPVNPTAAFAPTADPVAKTAAAVTATAAAAAAAGAVPSHARPLSDSGEYAASAEERKFLCLLDDGHLLVAEGHDMNPFVLSYCARLERLSYRYTTRVVSLDAVRRAYQGQRRDGTGERVDYTQMQVVAKNLIARACSERASDIHIRVNRFSTEILFRIHNELTRVSEQTREYGERLLATLYSAMASVSDNTYKPTERQDASIGDRDKLPEQLFGVRIATAPTSVGTVMVLRLLYNDAGEAADLTQLGFTPAQTATLDLLAQQPHGMNIISGPTGSGKSTTLQRVLSSQIRAMAGSIHVITVEDPVEYPIAGAVQTPVVNAGTEEARSLAFAAAIANAMRLDPDTIMIGEVRDRASAQSALRASMTGHQVWTTVHANGALAIVDRLTDLGLPLAMVTDESLVTGLISQRLVKLLCPHCARPFASALQTLDAALVARVKRAVGARFEQVRIAGPGCEHCSGGTIGRTVVAEVIRTDATLCELLRSGRKAAAHDYWLRELGGQTTAQHAVEKVAAGLVDPRMAERVVGHLPPAADGERPAIGAVGAVGAMSAMGVADSLAAAAAGGVPAEPTDGTRGGSYGT